MRQYHWGFTLCAVLSCVYGSPFAAAQPAASDKATPLFLGKDEGERRVWRPLEGDTAMMNGLPKLFIMKVDRVNGHSSRLVLGTEPLEPGGHIDTHRHPSADEILLLQTGTARVMVGGTIRVVHAGATVYIPANTWLSVANIGPDTIGLVYIFSAPGFDSFMREESVVEGAKATFLTHSEDAAIQARHARAVVYKDPEECAACTGTP